MPVGIVTGASRGLGRALTRALAERGWRLVGDARGEEALEAAVGSLGAEAGGSAGDGSPRLTGTVTAIPGDIGDPAHRQAIVEAAGDRIDLVVNNASLLGPSPQPPLADYPIDVLESVYRVNVLAPLALAQLALPRLQPGAAVVNVTSDAAVEPYEGWGGYGSSKAALDQLTAVLAAEHPALPSYARAPGHR